MKIIKKEDSMSKLYIEANVVGSYAANCYLVADKEKKECIIVDPGDEASVIIDRIKANGCTVKYILITHGHFDHTGAINKVREFTGAPAYINYNDYEWYKEAFKPDDELLDGAVFEFGDFKIKAIHIPGHTQGSTALYIESEDILFTGDTLFYHTVGRTDLMGGNHKQMIGSIINKLMVLPDHTTVLPGHAQKTTIGDERRHNIFIQG